MSMKMKITFPLLSGLIITNFYLGACESKFSESSPSTVKITGLPLEERVELKGKVDAKIDDIQAGAERAKKIVDMFRKIQDPTNKADVYTPIDFLIDINNELKEQIPENSEKGKVSRKGKIVLPFISLTNECRTVDILLESDISMFQKNVASSTAPANRLIYYIKTCASDGQFVPTIITEWNGPMIEFRVENENLHSLFSNILSIENLKTSTCQFRHNENKIIDSVYCNNIELLLSKSEVAHIKTMSFDNKGDIRFEATADIFENRLKKANSFIRVHSSGEVKFQVNKLGPNGEALPPTSESK